MSVTSFVKISATPSLSISDQEILVGQAVNRAIAIRNVIAVPGSAVPKDLDTTVLKDPLRWVDAGGLVTSERNLLSNAWDALVFRLRSDIDAAATSSSVSYTEPNGTIKYVFQSLTGHGFIFLGKW
jgi:hypothetical protein